MYASCDAMRLDAFDFHLPESSIAQEPAPERTASRLMVITRGPGPAPRHHRFADLPELFRPGDLLVVNRTRVIPARLVLRRARGGRVEALVIRVDEAGNTMEAWVRPARRVREGEALRVEGLDGVTVEVLGPGDDPRARVLRPTDLAPGELLERAGHVPLPPYIRRPDTPRDRERYQTVFARDPGSVAAPTAGLHFDAALLERLRRRGVAIADLTLHVGPGTFAPLDRDDVDANRLHAERYVVPADTVRAVRAARARGAHVVAVGTTTTRALETVAAQGAFDAPPQAPAQDVAGTTDLFIRPGHAFRAVDALLTNFHLPRSSLLVLVCAFAGRERILDAYAEAVRVGYRFYSYGDAMLIRPGDDAGPARRGTR